jgi:hypothetical protein
MRLAVAVLVSAPERIGVRLQAAAPHFGRVMRSGLPNRTAEELYMGIVAGLVEGGDEGGTVADSITALGEPRASEIARDMLRLYEIIADIDNERMQSSTFGSQM